MSPDPYRVSTSGRVADEIRAVLDEAERRGVGAAALAAFRTAVQQMARDPIEYGEAREILPAMGLRVRIAFEPPLVLQFGAHEAARIVWIRSVLLRVPGRR